MGDISIAPADEGHLDSIPRIELAAATRFSVCDLPLDVRYRVTEPASVRDALKRGSLWVATTDDDEAVGFAMADVLDGQAWLEEIDVLPQYWGRGIGTALVRTVLHWAGTQSHEFLALITFRHLQWNAPFYAGLGFEIVQHSEHGPGIRGLIEEEAAIGINTADRVVMRCPC